MSRRKAEVGIITFHCSNNYGAMLQAYGLKRFLCDSGIPAEIVRYEPPYMTGRHWWIPYAPIQGLKGRIWGLFHMWNGFRAHMRVKEQFSRQRANMNRFRQEYLIEKEQPKLLTAGAFRNRRKEKVIAYAASFGGASIHSRHDEKFARLIRYVDALSVREAAAIPYVRKFYKGDVRAVLDPVFFLGKEVWQEAERKPDRKGYILMYVTEGNEKMAEYAGILSGEKHLPVVEVRAGLQGADKGFELDVTAGPAEFLGYIHHAEYVVTNSFHAVAFSIIYQKKFLAFAHRSLSARLQNILQIHGLEDRICQDGPERDIDVSVDWEKVQGRTREAVQESRAFLLGNLS